MDYIHRAAEFARQQIKEQVSDQYVFHELLHTESVVQACLEIGKGMDCSSEELEILQLAAWFHDIGYSEGANGHETRSADTARDFLANLDYPKQKLEQVKSCILATKMPQTPQTKLECIICDADLSHLGHKNYWERSSLLRQEFTMVKQEILLEDEWIDREIQFLNNHSYHTEYAIKTLEDRKEKHIRQLIKQKARFYPDSEEAKILKKEKKKKKKKKEKLQESKLGRGVETMYRTTYRTHVNLSSIADNKANIMLSINAIIISIVLSSLVPKFDDSPKLIAPTVTLLIVCLISIVYATLSTRPKITEGKFTREDIELKRSNLLFFGNFYNMPLKDFHWGMKEMIKDNDFLYSSMTRDLYYLGIVLAKKYRYLSFCYNIFMYGLILTVAVYVASWFLPI